MQENMLRSVNRKKAGGAGLKGKLVGGGTLVRTKVTGHAGPGAKQEVEAG